MFSKYSVKKPYTVIVGIILVIVLGVISFQHMTTDLLPSMNLPYVVVYTTYVGATPEQVEDDVTRPMEAAFATLTDVKKITSQSRDNVSVVIMQFNDGANMDTALIEISSRLDQLRGDWNDDIGAPVAMKLNPDMLPVAILSVTRDDMDILALSDYVDDELIPAFESLNGVASAEASGIIQQRIDITIDQSRIDVLNSAVLKDVDKELSEVEDKLNDAQNKLSDGKRMLARAKKQAYKQLDDAEAAIAKGAKELPAAIEQLTKQRDELAGQRDELAQNVAALESVINMDDAQREQLVQLSQALAQLRQQKEQLEKQLAEAEAAASDPTYAEVRAEIVAQRDELAETLAQQKQYLSDLKLLDADALKEELKTLEADISEGEAALDRVYTELEALKTQREATVAQIDDLTRRIEAAESRENPQGDDGQGEQPQPGEGEGQGEQSQPGESEGQGQQPQSGEGEGQGQQPQPGEGEGQGQQPQSGEGEGQGQQPQPGEGEGQGQQPQSGEGDGQEQQPQPGDGDSQGEQPQSGDGEGQGEQPQSGDGDGQGQQPQSGEGEGQGQQPQSGDDEGQGQQPQPGEGEDQGQQPQSGEGEGQGQQPQSGDGDGQGQQPQSGDGDGQGQQPQSGEGEGQGQQPQSGEGEGQDEPSQNRDKADKDDTPQSGDEDKSDKGADKTGSSEPDRDSEYADDKGVKASGGEKTGANAEASDSDKEARAAAPAEESAPEAEDAGRSALRLNGALAEEADPDSLRAQLSAAEETLARLDQDIKIKSAEADGLSKALEEDRATLKARQGTLKDLTEDNENIQSRMDAAQTQIDSLTERIDALDKELAELDAGQAAQAAAPEALRQAIAQVDEQIAAIEGSEAYQAIQLLEDPEGLNVKYAEAQEGLAQMNAGLQQMDDSLDKLNKGIIPAGSMEGINEDTSLEDARVKLKDARKQLVSAFANASSQLSDAEDKLAKARKEFNDQRDDALEKAGLDGIITIQTVSGLIGAQNIAMPAGYVYDADDEQVLVRVGDKFDTLDGIRRLKLFKLGLDSVDEIRLLDVARVELTDDRDDVFTKLNGQDGILLSLDKQSTYSTADVARTVMARAKALAEENPNLHIVDLMNQGEYISIIVDSVLNNLLSGGGLAILILLLFLMDFRPTITVAFSIPISVVIAFVCMYFSGITLNVLSLSGLSLGIGMLVDNSIVAIENIYRLHDEEGVPLLRACVEGVRSVSGALFASTLTTICVFLPIVFVQGMARDLFSDMGLSIAYSLLASLFVAMTVVPAMCSFLMRRSKPHRHRIFGAIQRFYGMLLRGALRVKPLVLLAALGLLAFAALQVSKMGISFMPEVNSRQMSATLTFDPEMKEKDQQAQAMAIMEEMMNVKGVESVGLMGSSSSILSMGNGGDMSYYINIDESRERKNVDIAREMEDIGKKLGADLSVQATTMDISMMTGSGIQVEITGDDLQTLQAIAKDVAELARQTEGVTDVDDGLEDAVPELRIEVDKEKATDEGLTTGQILQFIAQKVAGRVKITQVTLDGKELDLYVEDGESSELKPAELEDLEIEVDQEGKNKMVRIGDVAAIRDSQSLSTIKRASQRRLVTVSFDIADGYSANLVSDAFKEKLKGYDVPAGYNVDLTGENETVMGIMNDLVWMVLVAILLIFLIMVAQFQSFKSPIIIMFTIPLAFTGGLLGLLITGMDLSIVSMIGFLVLSGVVVNNGIVFIDCVNQLRIGGMEKREALIETGRIRLRPILMTAMTTILGMSTMALGQGTGAEMMQPMAVVSVGGLSYATLMTLFVVPVLYDLLNGKTMKAREIQMIKEAAGLTGDEVLNGEDRTEAETSTESPSTTAPVEAAPPVAIAPEASVEATAATSETAIPAATAPEASVEATAAKPEAAPAAAAPEVNIEATTAKPEAAAPEANVEATAAKPEATPVAAAPKANAEAAVPQDKAASDAPAPKPLRIRLRPRMPF